MYLFSIPEAADDDDNDADDETEANRDEDEQQSYQGEDEEEEEEEEEVDVSKYISVSLKRNVVASVKVTFNRMSPIFRTFFSSVPKTHPVFTHFFCNKKVKEVRVRLSEDFNNFDSNPTTTIKDIAVDDCDCDYYIWPLFEPV